MMNHPLCQQDKMLRYQNMVVVWQVCFLHPLVIYLNIIIRQSSKHATLALEGMCNSCIPKKVACICGSLLKICHLYILRMCRYARSKKKEKNVQACVDYVLEIYEESYWIKCENHGHKVLLHILIEELLFPYYYYYFLYLEELLHNKMVSKLCQ